MSLDSVIKFMKLNLTGPEDEGKCLDFIQTLNLSPDNQQYAKEMLSRWISVKMFRKDPVLSFQPQSPNDANPIPPRTVFEFTQEHHTLFSDEERREAAIYALQDWLVSKRQ